MPFFIVRILSIAGLVLLAACGDDDDTPDDSDGSVDSGAGSTDAATKDSSVGDKDGGGRADGALDSGTDAGGDAAACALEHFPLLDLADGDEVYRYCARRVPLSDCPSCPESLSAFSEGLTCSGSGEDAGAEEDAGADGSPTIRTRSEGCGSVQFHVVDGHFDGYYNFDPQTGQLIGAAVTNDDVVESIPGCACGYLHTWVTGEVRASCADETVTTCRR